MTQIEIQLIVRLAVLTILGAVCFSAWPSANAQLAACINQCDAIGYQCERNVNDEYQRCLDHRDSRIHVCEREGNEKRNYCLRNRAPSCDLSGQFAFDRCMTYIQPCNLSSQRCDASIRTCVQRCENEAAATKAPERQSPRLEPRPKLTDFEADIHAAQQPEIRVYKFEHSDQLNEFKLADEDYLFVRNLRTNGNHGKWHKYTRIEPSVFKAATSSATYTLVTEDIFIWDGGGQTITLIRQTD